MPFWLLSLESRGKLNGLVEATDGQPVTTILMDAKISNDLLEYCLKLANGRDAGFLRKAPKSDARDLLAPDRRHAHHPEAIMEAI